MLNERQIYPQVIDVWLNFLQFCEFSCQSEIIKFNPTNNEFNLLFDHRVSSTNWWRFARLKSFKRFE